MTIPISPFVAVHRLGEQRVEELQIAAARRQAINQSSGKPPRRRRPDRRTVLDHWNANFLVWIVILMVVAGAVIVGSSAAPGSSVS